LLVDISLTFLEYASSDDGMNQHNKKGRKKIEGKDVFIVVLLLLFFYSSSFCCAVVYIIYAGYFVSKSS